MAASRANPFSVKQHYSYTASGLAVCLGVHKNTVRHWQRKGLAAIDGCRPLMFHGAAVRDFLLKQRAARKQPCSPSELLCLRCRKPQKPAEMVVEFLEMRPGSGNLRAACKVCGARMHRRIREADLGRLMPGCVVQHRHRDHSLMEHAPSSLNCDSSQDDR